MLEMLADPAGRIAMGEKARAHVGVAYASKVIGPLQEASYLPRDRAGPPSARSGGGSMTPYLSVVLCTHNPRRTVLEETLAALRRQQPLDEGGGS